ncbi:MAG: tRNA (guanosine(46)-N7)-methyltransferase TrmB [Chitinophagales bacterium]
MAAGRKNKQKKIAEINTLPNVFQAFGFADTQLQDAAGERLNYKGQWAETVFKNRHPLVLELACGKGDYTVALAAQQPQVNFVGIDIKGPRIHTGARHALENGLTNVAFMRFKIENLLNFFAPQEVAGIWITFPDPFPKDRHEKHRLTHHAFLERYNQILQPGGIVNFKTDDLDLFRYTAASVKAYGAPITYYREDIYSAPLEVPELEIKTFYERQHLKNGRTINFMQWSRK